MAAEILSRGGAQVDVYDSMPSVGRKFLLAGKGGLNLTHSEPLEPFLSRYCERREAMAPLLAAFGPDALVAWVRELGIETFVGSSGRVFPQEMKAAPLLRAWLHRLRVAGVRFHLRHRWCGWTSEGLLSFITPQGESHQAAAATILAAGGASWPQLGSDGAWVPLLEARGVSVAALRPSNCGFDVASPRNPANRAESVAAQGESVAAQAESPVNRAEKVTDRAESVAANPGLNTGWSEHFRSRFAGQPLKPVVVNFTDRNGNVFRRQGEFVVTQSGVEGSLIYALSARLRDEIAATGFAVIHLDLLPDRDLQHVINEVAHPRGARSLSSHLQSRLGLKGVKTSLLREVLPKDDMDHPERLARAIKSLPVRLIAPRPMAEAISTAGGVPFEALDPQLMIRALPGVFCAGEMLDWEAPTGGYLLTACFASGRAAGLGALAWLSGQGMMANFQ